DISSDQAQRLTGDRSLHVTRQPSPWVFYMFTNDDPQISAVTSSTRFQQAVRNALDYKGLVAVAGRGALHQRSAVRDARAEGPGEPAGSGIRVGLAGSPVATFQPQFPAGHVA